MDVFDRRIIFALQQNGRTGLADLSEEIGLSRSACHRRIHALEEQGIISGYEARLDRKKLGLNLEVFAEITLNSQHHELLEKFEEAVLKLPDVIECHLMGGQFDYLLRLAVKDADDYARVHRERLSLLPGIARMQSTFVLKTVLSWKGYSVPG